VNDWQDRTERERRALEAEDRRAMFALAVLAAITWALWAYVCAAG